MRTKLLFVFLLSMLLTVFCGSAFGGVPGKISCPQDLVKLQLKTQSKSAAKTVALPGTGSISGIVKDFVSHAGVPDITVTAIPVGDYCSRSGGSATTIVNGSYEITGLIAGAYKVEFTRGQMYDFLHTPPFYIEQWYNNTYDEAGAAVVQVTEGIPITGINADLKKGGSISGTVTNSSGAELSMISVEAVGSNGYTASTFTGMTMTGTDGSYIIYGLPTDSYTVSFSSFDQGDSSTVYVGADYPTAVSVTAPADRPNINIVLANGGSITGKLIDTSNNPIPNVIVYAVKQGSPDPTAYGFTGVVLSDATGNFTIGGLASGTYDVIINGRMASDYTNPSSPVYKGYILVKQLSVSVSSSSSVPTNIGTMTLKPGGMIKGTVKNKSGAALKDVAVIGYDDVSGEIISVDWTADNGTYTLTGFGTDNGAGTGTYKVQFFACQGSYAEQWYNGKTTQASADTVTVTPPNVITGIDGVLDLAGTSDTTPPVTTASPLGGTFSTPQTVSLTANEAATIYYTTNGSPPTTASSVYTSPLTIATSTTLKYFARDTAGNSESVQSQTYTITAAVSGECGSSANQTFATAPTTNLCNFTTTTPTVTVISDQWRWTCTGSNGVNAMCLAYMPGAAPIQGDCNGDKLVSIDEVQSAINMFLGSGEVRGCVDWDANAVVTIAEVQKVINGFLGL